MSDREDAQRRIVTALAQHVSYLHRTGTAHVNKALAIIDEMSAELPREIGERLDNLTPAELQAFARGRYHTTRLKGLRDAIDRWVSTLGERIKSMSLKELAALADQEAGYVRDLIAQAVEGEIPPAPAVASAALSRPVMGEFVEDMLADIGPATRNRVYSTIRQGVSEGQSNSQIIRALRGTPALKYRDGVLQTTRNNVDNVVRTARQHMSNEAYRETYNALGVTHVVWVAQLEGRTCRRCAPLDGRRWKIDEPHPEPPLHHRCRCSLAPSLDGDFMGQRPYVRALKVKGRDDQAKFRSIGNMTKKQREAAGLEVGQVSAGTTYADWFASQSARYQREWLGDRRYRLYKEGGYSLDRFTDPRQREYTLDELRARDRETFAEVFGEAA
ncbi:phage minor head protein [Halomonas sp. SCS19]|uniref:phage minor head protein n=1 Tax=Halomonas sp. SCS19 TaxID=2950870 RepID=UPI0032E00092